MLQKIKNNTFARNSFILFVGSMVANILNYLFHLVVGRMVSVEIYGEIESLVSLISIISIPAMALTMIATKFSAGRKADNDKAGNHVFLKLINKKVFLYIIPIFLIAFLLTPVVRKFLNIESYTAVILVWFIMAISFFSSITSGILNGWQKFKESSWAGIGGAFLKLIGAVFLIKSGFSLSGAIGGFFIGALVTYLLSIYFLRFLSEERKKPLLNLKKEVDFSSLKKYVMPVLWGNVAINILGNVDMVLAKHSLNATEAGQYGALTIVSKIIFFATGIIAIVLFSMSSESNHRKNNSQAILKNALWLMSLFSAVAMAAFFVFPDFVLGLVFGGKYNDVSWLLGWFSIIVVAYSFVNLFFQYFLSIHQTKIVYAFLAVSIFEVVTVLFVGHTISAILVTVIISQVLALAISLVYLAKIHKVTR